jgi:hypothetical protein
MNNRQKNILLHCYTLYGKLRNNIQNKLLIEGNMKKE